METYLETGGTISLIRYLQVGIMAKEARIIEAALYM